MTTRWIVVLSLVLASCAPTDVVDVGNVAGGTAPPAAAELADVTWPDAARWIERATDGGSPVVVKLFASWCAPCRDEAVVILDALPRHPDVTFLGIDHEDQRDAAVTFMDETGLDAIPTLYDPQGEVARAAMATGMPSTLFFDTDGRLAEVHLGPLTADDLDASVARLRG